MLAACQAIEFLRPLKTTVPLEEVYKAVRSVARPWDKDRYMSPDILEVTKILKAEKIWNAVRHHMEDYHRSQSIETRVFSPTSFMLAGPQWPKPSEVSAKGKKRKSEDASKSQKNGAHDNNGAASGTASKKRGKRS